MDLLEKIFGSKNQRKLKKIQPLLKAINELEKEESIDEKMDRLVENKRAVLNEVLDGEINRDKGESIINELLAELAR